MFWIVTGALVGLVTVTRWLVNRRRMVNPDYVRRLAVRGRPLGASSSNVPHGGEVSQLDFPGS